MSAHHLTIAKASFAAGLLRPDITKVGRDDLTTFHTLLEAATTMCTASNVQKCKEWIIANIAPSAARSAALGKYLSSLSKHAQEAPSDTKGKSATASRRKLHIIYVLHDVVHHTKYHTRNLSAFSTFTASLQSSLVDLVQSAAAEHRARIKSRLHALFEVWEVEKFYSKDYVNKLQDIIDEAGTSEHGADENILAKESSQHETFEHAFMMPASHGDPSTPYYDLPAGNLLPFLDPGSSAPIHPEQIKPLQFIARPADKPLVNALKDFLKDVGYIEYKNNTFGHDMDSTEIDELGQITIRDEAGDVTGDTYYGWSRAFCEKMKRRRRGQDGDENRRRSLSRGSSRSSSRSPRKRRRYSDSTRSMSPSHSRSRSPPRFRPALPPKLSNKQSREHRMFANESRSYPPPPPVMAANLPTSSALFQTPPLGPNGLPIPPPRPLNWNGPWPPPPPPNAAIGGLPFPPAHMGRGNNFPPPPPPPAGYPGMYNNNYYQ